MKRLPPALVLALGLQVALGLAAFIEYEKELVNYMTWSVIQQGGLLAFDVLLITGLAIYARGLRESRALGAKIAMWSRVVVLGQFVGYVLLSIVSERGHALKDFDTVMAWILPFAALAAAIGFTLATRQMVLGIIAIVIAFVAEPIPPLATQLAKVLPHGHTVVLLFQLVPYLVLPAMYLVMVLRVPEEDAGVSSTDPAVLLRNAAGALYLRLWAALALALITLMAAMSAGSGLATIGVFKLISMVSPVLDLIGMFLFARALLRLSSRGVQPWLATWAAAFVLFAACAMFAKIPELYQAFYGRDGGGFGGAAEIMQAGSLLIPVVACFGIAMAMRIVVALASEYRDDQMRENVSVRTIVFVVLTLGILFVVNYGFPRMPPSEGLIMFMLLAVAVGSIYALVLAARICREGAELIERGGETNLPVAKIV